jgi:hypothetical protein
MTSQVAFRNALLDAARPIPEGLVDAQGQPAGARYSVYRNNVAVSLREALETGFPAVAKLIGPDNFAKAAGLFLRQTPPSSPLMMHYGAGFPEFLASLEPLKPIGYLADVARLELMLRKSYHAADHTPLDPARLQNLSEEQLMAARLELAPSALMLRSLWPLHSIYHFTMSEGGPQPPARAEDVLITRPEFDPEPHLLPPGAGDFIEALLADKCFGDALAVAGDAFDLGGTLGLLLQGGALTDIHL